MIRNMPGQFVGAYITGYTGSPRTSGTTTVYLTGDNGTQTSIGTATHKGNGYWSFALTAAQTNYGHCAFLFANSTSSTLDVTIQVYPKAAPVLLVTTIATLASQTSFTLTDGSANDDAYNGCLAVVTDTATSMQVAVGVVSDYTGSTKTITLLNDPAIFTMAVNDTVTIVASRSLKPATDNRTLVVDASGLADANTVKIGPTGSGTAQTALDLGGVIADSVPADGSRPTIQQALYMITQFLLDRSVSGTTVTVKKVDGSTTLLTCTLDDGTTPTSITRAT